MENIYKKWFWIFVLPALLLFTFVILLPAIMGVYNSFAAWRGIYYVDPSTGIRAQSAFHSLVGFANYKAAFRDERFMRALWYTVRYTVLAVVTINAVALGLALLVNCIIKYAGLFRTVFFLPNMLGGLALGFI
ncbi:MAG: hypothetical protein LBH43_09305 [Treponema sp.]|jgi:raffinose/stachyose/melibiose transport system permease protein|nr:hypothetical protein [Treponema sp.]